MGGFYSLGGFCPLGVCVLGGFYHWVGFVHWVSFVRCVGFVRWVGFVRGPLGGFGGWVGYRFGCVLSGLVVIGNWVGFDWVCCFWVEKIRVSFCSLLSIPNLQISNFSVEGLAPGAAEINIHWGENNRRLFHSPLLHHNIIYSDLVASLAILENF